MSLFAKILCVVVALQHVAFFVLEAFLFTKPIGLKTFGLKAADAEIMKSLAQNQGLYNGFLAAGLVWAVVGDRRDVAIFFCACVVVAGIVGGITVKPSIIFVQAVPAAIALALVLFTR